jgi:hypothetical protein
VIATVALPGLLIAPPVLGADNTKVNDRVPENGVALMMGTQRYLAVASPSAHHTLPVVAVKSVPATAVPLLAA